MVVQHNLQALNAGNIFKRNVKFKAKSMEKLGSGFRVNRAADDAAALSISEKMRNQIRGLNQAVNNIEDGISYVQVADGSLSEIHSMLHRVEELAVKAANDTNASEDRRAIDNEVQELKKEIQSIFERTEFNGIKIWDTKLNSRIQIGTEERQAVVLQKTSASINVTEANKGAIAYNGYQIKVKGTDPADVANYGFTVEWEGWNGNAYSTELISWNEVGVGKKQSFGMNIKDYIDTTTYPELQGIQLQIGWKMEESATIDDIKASIDSVRFSGSVSSSESVLTSQSVNGVSFSVSTNYLAELASDRNMDAYDTSWIEAKDGIANVVTRPTYTDVAEETGWEIKFDMQNVGTVTAKSGSIRYYSNDQDDDDENHWWHWAKRSNGTYYKVQESKNPGAGGDGTLHAITDIITNSTGNMGANGKGYSLTHDAEHGGYIHMDFTLTPDSGSVTYGGRSGSSIGSISMTIQVYDTDTEDTLMQRVKQALNENTIFDIYEGNQSTNTPYRATQHISSASAKKHMIDAPIYQATHDLVIQSGANSGDTMHIQYESLRLKHLGLEDAEVTSHKSASQTIASVQEAVKVVSAQRSLFGAYANRMERTLDINLNYSENLQTAESVMRDTDMAEEVTELARLDILQQAAQAMIANANQQPELVLQLLQ